MDSKTVIKALLKDGWIQVGQKGSHKQFPHPVKPGRVTVPHPVKELKIGTLKSIAKQAGLRF
jgi:predicted RNA binding protein YcfA (HicA-like mRNA interferase family)